MAERYTKTYVSVNVDIDLVSPIYGFAEGVTPSQGVKFSTVK